MTPTSPPSRSRAVSAVVGAVAVAVALSVVAACGSSAHTAATESTAPTNPGTGAPAGPDATAGPGATTDTTVDPGTLPQSRDQPGTTDTAFQTGVQALWQGIVADDPAPAMAFFFPLSAYRQVKAVKDPAADWQDRLVAAFRRDVHRLHAQLGADAAQATLGGLDVPAGAARWVNPGEESNKLGYWRVYGSTLRYSVGGVTRSLPIYSLISWRGAWYVVHVGHP